MNPICRLGGLFLVTMAALVCVRAQAAETVHLYLTIDGKPIAGESMQRSLGRENSIECLEFHQGVAMAGERKQHEPITIRKRIDKSSPLLCSAVVTGSNGEAVLKFFRPNPKGDGTTEQFYTITLKGVRVMSVRQVVPNTLDPELRNQPPQEEVTFAFRSIVWNFTSPDIKAEDTAAVMGTVRAPATTTTKP